MVREPREDDNEALRKFDQKDGLLFIGNQYDTTVYRRVHLSL